MRLAVCRNRDLWRLLQSVHDMTLGHRGVTGAVLYILSHEDVVGFNSWDRFTQLQLPIKLAGSRTFLQLTDAMRVSGDGKDSVKIIIAI